MKNTVDGKWVGDTVSNTVKGFPQLFHGNKTTQIEGTMSFWKAHATYYNDQGNNATHGTKNVITSLKLSGTKRVLLKALAGRGIHKQAWVEYLYYDLRDE